MVQVFGNRIIGGVGAPGGGMSESFGTGVNTALDQRGARQTMAIRDQEMAWRAEDRAEAKRRRLAAEAAGAAARARQAAIFGAATSGSATPFFQLGAPAAPAPAAGATGSTLPRSMGAPAGASVPAPAPRAGAMPRGGAGLSMGAPVAGGAGAGALRGDPGGDYLPAGDVVAPLVGVRPPIDAAQARPGARLPVAAGDQRGFVGRMFGGALASSADLPALQRERQTVLDELNAVARSGVGGAELPALQRELAEIDQQIEAVKMAPAPSTVRGPTELEGPEATGTFLTEAPTMALDDISVTSPQAGLSFGPSVPPAPLLQGGQMTFGPQLGVAQTPTEMFLADLNLQPPGQLSLSDLMQDYAGPLADPRNAPLLEQGRAMWAAVAQDAAARKDVGAYMAALAKVQEQEDLILGAQLMRGITEATQFNSPQRLSAVASMVSGIDMFIAPKAGGKADIYVNGELTAPDRDLGAIINDLRMQLDEGYRAKQAELAGKREEKAIETEASVALALAKAQLDPSNVVLEADANTGDIVVFDKLQQRLIGVITRTNPTDPEQTLPAPTFVPIN